MSTSIDVYPTLSAFPLVDETRQRTQELFQHLLNDFDIQSTIEVKAFFSHKDDEGLQYVDPSTRWSVEMHLGFAYFVNGEWRASSWPSLWARERITQSYVDSYEKYGPDDGYPASMLGEFLPIEEDDFEVPLSADELKLLNMQDHSWDEYRNMGGPVISSIGYGFVAAALAEETEGRIASVDGALPSGHSGETASQFLQWWGSERISSYGVSPFL